MNESAFKLANYLVIIPLLIIFGGIALLYTFMGSSYYKARFGKSLFSDKEETGEMETVGEFLVARGAYGPLLIGWSIYASSIGTWVITAVTSYAAIAGLLGMCMYVISSSFLPILLILTCGSLIQMQYPTVTSLNDFIRLRFGPIVQILVVLVMLFNMMVALLVEYVTIGAMFADFVNSSKIPAILTLSITTMIYSSIGGTRASIFTDLFQGVATVLFFLVLMIYVPVTFDEKLSDHALSKDLKGFNKLGYSAILTMPLSLMTGVFFSEAVS